MLRDDNIESNYFCLQHLFFLRNTSKKYNIMAFNAGDKVNCSTWTQVRFKSVHYLNCGVSQSLAKIKTAPLSTLRLVWKET